MVTCNLLWVLSAMPLTLWYQVSMAKPSGLLAPLIYFQSLCDLCSPRSFVFSIIFQGRCHLLTGDTTSLWFSSFFSHSFKSSTVLSIFTDRKLFFIHFPWNWYENCTCHTSHKNASQLWKLHNLLIQWIWGRLNGADSCQASCWWLFGKECDSSLAEDGPQIASVQAS